MSVFYVAANLNHDGKGYTRGDKLNLSQEDAAQLLAAGVLSTDEPQDAIAAPAAIVEETKEAEVGGEPSTSGEPSIDETVKAARIPTVAAAWH